MNALRDVLAVIGALTVLVLAWQFGRGAVESWRNGVGWSVTCRRCGLRFGFPWRWAFRLVVAAHRRPGGVCEQRQAAERERLRAADVEGRPS